MRYVGVDNKMPPAVAELPLAQFASAVKQKLEETVTGKGFRVDMLWPNNLVDPESLVKPCTDNPKYPNSTYRQYFPNDKTPNALRGNRKNHVIFKIRKNTAPRRGDAEKLDATIVLSQQNPGDFLIDLLCNLSPEIKNLLGVITAAADSMPDVVRRLLISPIHVGRPGEQQPVPGLLRYYQEVHGFDDTIPGDDTGIYIRNTKRPAAVVPALAKGAAPAVSKRARTVPAAATSRPRGAAAVPTGWF